MEYIYRIKYKKDGPLRFISHLDLNALFRRTLRRTKMPVELTQGYNPRIKISFGPALPLGVEGWQEILDIYTPEEINEEKIKEKINQAAPMGLTITEVEEITLGSRSLGKLICYAVYHILIEVGEKQEIKSDDGWADRMGLLIRQFLDRENIMYEKRTKKGLKLVDLRPFIKEMTLSFGQEKNKQMMIRLVVDIQYQGSINPSIIIQAFLAGIPNNKEIAIKKIMREQFILGNPVK